MKHAPLVVLLLAAGLFLWGAHHLVTRIERAIRPTTEVIGTIKDTLRDRIIDRVKDETIGTTPPKTSDTVPTPPANDAPKTAPVLVMHTADWCVPCQAAKQTVLPEWRAAGYTIRYVDHTDTRLNPSPYALPWYEIIRSNGERVTHNATSIRSARK